MYDTQKPDVEELIHYGKKGMKWGVRNAASKTGSSGKRAAKAVGRGAKRASIRIGDAAFEVNAKSTSVENQVLSKGGSALRKNDLPKINAKPEYVKASRLRHRLKNPGDPATKAYRAEVKQAYIKRLDEAARSMENSSKTRRYTIKDADGDLPKSDVYWEVRSTRLEHANDFSLVRVVMDDNGFITDLAPVKDTLEQGADLVNDILIHSGTEPI